MLREPGWLLVNALQAIGLALWTAAWVTVAFFAWIFTGFSRHAPLWLARRCWAPWGLRLLSAKLHVERPSGVAWDQPHVYVMNHQSMADIPAAFAAVPTDLVFIAKHVLQYVPFLGWYMSAMGMIFVDRRAGERAIRSLQRAATQIRAGTSVLAYPEGTRSPDGRIQAFKKGPFQVALQAGVPIIPVAIEGAQHYLPRGGFRLRPATIRVKLGAPIPTQGLTADQLEPLMRRVRDAVIELHRELGGAGGDRNVAIAAKGHEGGRDAAEAAARPEGRSAPSAA